MNFKQISECHMVNFYLLAENFHFLVVYSLKIGVSGIEDCVGIHDTRTGTFVIDFKIRPAWTKTAMW